MDAIREVRVIQHNVITINVPDQLVNRTVEIIVLPLNDQDQIQDAWPGAGMGDVHQNISYLPISG